jgi:rSAM/selenodomain-associated transferase 1
MRTTICLMLKVPRPGEVKTRLGKEIGFEQAERIYRKLVEKQVAQLSGQEIEIHYTPSDEGGRMQEWLGPVHQYLPQSDGDLGERLKHAMRGAFRRGADAVLFLGGDCPDVTQDVILAACSLLTKCDVVIGPAQDGGYYLLGLKSDHPRVFEEINWSTDRVFTQTTSRLQELHLTSGTLPLCDDVDDLPSLTRARSRHPFLR